MAQDHKKRVSLKKAVAALETLLSELDELPAEKDLTTGDDRVEGMRQQLRGMVLTMKGACHSRDGQTDFSFPS